jgi:hypothetical protein
MNMTKLPLQKDFDTRPFARIFRVGNTVLPRLWVVSRSPSQMADEMHVGNVVESVSVNNYGK